MEESNAGLPAKQAANTSEQAKSEAEARDGERGFTAGPCRWRAGTRPRSLKAYDCPRPLPSTTSEDASVA